MEKILTCIVKDKKRPVTISFTYDVRKQEIYIRMPSTTMTVDPVELLTIVTKLKRNNRKR